MRKPSPRFPRWLLSQWLNEAYLEEFLGDLDEIYESRLIESGRHRAMVMYWVDAIHLFFGFVRSNRITTQKHNNMMLKSMFTMAWRSSIRQKQFTLLNLLGLTLGITTCLIIGLYVHNEMTHDTFLTNKDRIYRINQPMIWNDWDEQFASTGPNVGVALREEAPEFEEVTRILGQGPQTLRVRGKEGDRLFKESRFFPAEENFLKVFQFEVIMGERQNPLAQPGSLVITQETAERYFGLEDPIGRIIELKELSGEWTPMQVTAVIANIPDRSHLQFDFLSSFNTYPYIKEQNWKWIWTAFSTYGLVKEGTDVTALESKIQAIPPKYAGVTTEKIFNMSFEDYTQGREWKLHLQPLNELYLSADPDSHRFGPTGNPMVVRLFMGIGALILILSCINFMNLSTARSANRAKEVGIRKVLGSRRKTLMQQFVFESVLYVAFSAFLAVLMTLLVLPAFNVLAEKSLSLNPALQSPVFYGILLSFVLLLGVFSGSYPAFYLSAFRPIETLKGKVSRGFKGIWVRNGLVIFQFTISIALLICAVFVQRQLSYASRLDLGLEQEHVLQLHNIEQLENKGTVLQEKLKQLTAFTQAGLSYATPPNVWGGERYRAEGPDAVPADMSNFRAEGEYLDLLQLDFLAGRNFDKTRPADRYGVVLNEEAVKVLGWGTRDTYASNSPIGKKVICAFDNEDELEVVGVVKDFNFSTVKSEIAPLIIINPGNDKMWNYGWGRQFLSLRLDPAVIQQSGQLTDLLAKVEQEMAKLDPTIVFEYSFMDQEFETTFRAERQMGKILNVFTLMAMLIACLGLFGLAAFSAEQRTKELGIRKVLGARVTALVFTFSAEFTKLILFSILLAVPAAYFYVDYWLSDFAYRTPIQAWVFLAAVAGALVIAWLTTGFQSLSVAYRNPVKALKEE